MACGRFNVRATPVLTETPDEVTCQFCLDTILDEKTSAVNCLDGGVRLDDPWQAAWLPFWRATAAKFENVERRA
jgi:hypothetical protein